MPWTIEANFWKKKTSILPLPARTVGIFHAKYSLPSLVHFLHQFTQFVFAGFFYLLPLLECVRLFVLCKMLLNSHLFLSNWRRILSLCLEVQQKKNYMLHTQNSYFHFARTSTPIQWNSVERECGSVVCRL